MPRISDIEDQEKEGLDLPIVVALLSSYLHQEVDAGTLFVGEVDLTKQVRPPERTYLAGLAELLSVPPRIKRVYLSEKAAEEFAAMRPSENGPSVGERVMVRGVSDLESLIQDLWPSLSTGGT